MYNRLNAMLNFIYIIRKNLKNSYFYVVTIFQNLNCEQMRVFLNMKNNLNCTLICVDDSFVVKSKILGRVS